LINSVGLQNPGIDKVVSEELPNLAKIYKKKIIANISGFSIEEYVECAKKIDVVENVGIIEVNVSCPNVHNGGMAYGVSAKSVSEVTKAVKEVTQKPVYIKLSPNVTDIVEADGLSLINTLLGMRIDIRKKAPVIANKMGGFSGPAIFPVAVRMVYQVANAVKIPVIGMGGVSSAQDVIEMMMAGASAVQVGSANLVNPFVCKEIIDDLPQIMSELGIKSLSEIIGIVK